MAEYKRHHILPKTYLKYFSQNDSGKGIIVLNFNSSKKVPEIKNQGDSIFCGKYFYKDTRLKNELVIEKFLGREIESEYPKIIQNILTEHEINDWAFKTRLLNWIVYSQIRSPAIRKDFEVKIGILNKLDQMRLQNSSFIDEKIIIDIKTFSKEFHLDHFINQEIFKKTSEAIISGLMVKKWEIIIAPIGSNFWTSDNPGFTIHLDDCESAKQFKPHKYLGNFTSNSVHYFPLTKKYCLEFSPYLQSDPLNLNFQNDIIKFKKVDKNCCDRINIWTTITACNFVIMDESVIEVK